MTAPNIVGSPEYSPNFVDSILDQSITPIVPQQDVYDVMSVCFAAEEAMNTGKNTIIK